MSLYINSTPVRNMPYQLMTAMTKSAIVAPAGRVGSGISVVVDAYGVTVCLSAGLHIGTF